MTDKELKLKLDRARWWVLTNQPFYGQMCMRLRDEIVDDAVAPTAQTDGACIQWGRTFLGDLRPRRSAASCCCTRPRTAPTSIPGACPATRRAIRPATTPSTARSSRSPASRCRKAGCSIGSTTGSPRKRSSAGSASARSQRGRARAAAARDRACPIRAARSPRLRSPAPIRRRTRPRATTLQASWERAVIQAAQMANRKGLGDLPADIARQLERLRATPIDWQQALADFVKTAASARNDWARPARRHAWQPVIYPRKRRDQVGTIVFARDTSGSVDDRTESLYAACVTAAMAETGARPYVIDCDTAINAEYRLAPGEPCPLKAQGGGGTHFAPVFAQGARTRRGGNDRRGRLPDRLRRPDRS